MRTITTTTDVYSFDELSDKAKQNAIDSIREGHTEYNHLDEYQATLDAFEKVFPINITNYSYGPGSYSYVRFEFTSDNVEEFTGIRLMKYLWNNYRTDLFKGKYYFLWSKTEKSYKHYKEGYPVLKQRHSKVMFDNSCVLTGVCFDMDILQPVYDFLNKPDVRISFKQLIKDCLESFVKGVVAAMEYEDSDEYILEEISDNDYEFTIHGKQIMK